MKDTRHSEEQIIAILKQGEAGVNDGGVFQVHCSVVLAIAWFRGTDDLVG